MSLNTVSIIIIAAIALCAVVAAVKIIRDKKKGKTSCGGSCAGCPYSSQCSKKDG